MEEGPGAIALGGNKVGAAPEHDAAPGTGNPWESCAGTSAAWPMLDACMAPPGNCSGAGACTGAGYPWAGGGGGASPPARNPGGGGGAVISSQPLLPEDRLMRTCEKSAAITRHGLTSSLCAASAVMATLWT